MSADIPRLTPAALHLLVAIARGTAILRRSYLSLEFGLILPPRPGEEDESYDRIHARAPNTLIRLGLIEKKGRSDWRVSAAGRAWLDAIGIAAKSDKPRNR